MIYYARVMKSTVILGASPKEDRYAYKAQLALQKGGHEVIPVHPTETEILGEEVIHELKDVWQAPHTVTVYINPTRFAPLVDDLIAVGPQRIIFNPGTECPELYHEFPDHIEVIEACTLVMLSTGQY